MLKSGLEGGDGLQRGVLSEGGWRIGFCGAGKGGGACKTVGRSLEESSSRGKRLEAVGRLRFGREILREGRKELVRNIEEEEEDYREVEHR